MISIYLDIVKDALYPRRRGVLSKRNAFIRVSELEEMDADAIRKLRQKLHLSVALFADVLGVSSKTVNAWESGRNVPQGSSLRLMNMLSRYPDILRAIVYGPPLSFLTLRRSGTAYVTSTASS